MTNYSDNPRMTRVEFFQVRESGCLNWYATEAIEWKTYKGYRDGGKMIDEAFLEALEDALYDHRNGKLRFGGMVAVCLDPYHADAYPQAIKVPTYPKLPTYPKQRRE